MQSLLQSGGVFNTPSESAPDLFTLTSRTTGMGHRSHTVQTRNRDLAFNLFEQALEVDIEPDFAVVKGLYTIEFICDDGERDEVVEAARQGRGVVLC